MSRNAPREATPPDGLDQALLANSAAILSVSLFYLLGALDVRTAERVAGDTPVAELFRYSCGLVASGHGGGQRRTSPGVALAGDFGFTCLLSSPPQRSAARRGRV